MHYNTLKKYFNVAILLWVYNIGLSTPGTHVDRWYSWERGLGMAGLYIPAELPLSGMKAIGRVCRKPLVLVEEAQLSGLMGVCVCVLRESLDRERICVQEGGD